MKVSPKSRDRIGSRRAVVSLFAALLVAGISAIAAPARAQQAVNPPLVRLTKVEGTVQVQRPGEPGPTAAPANLPLEQGFTLATQNGTAEIEWADGTTGFLGNDSTLEITELAPSPNGNISRLTMRGGTARFYGNTARNGTFAVLTADVTVTPQPAGDFRLDVYRDGTSVTVLQGQALVQSLGAGWTVAKGQTLAMRAGDVQPIIGTSPPITSFSRLAGNDLVGQMQAIAAQRGAPLPPASTPPNGNYVVTNPNSSYTFLPVYGWGWQPMGQGAESLALQNGIHILSPSTRPDPANKQPWGVLPYPYGQWQYSPQGLQWIPTPGTNTQPPTAGEHARQAQRLIRAGQPLASAPVAANNNASAPKFQLPRPYVAPIQPQQGMQSTPQSPLQQQMQPRQGGLGQIVPTPATSVPPPQMGQPPQAGAPGDAQDREQSRRSQQR